MKYYVIYEEYSEYNQFEGEWYEHHEKFHSLELAKDFIKICEKSGCLKFIAGPLLLVE